MCCCNRKILKVIDSDDWIVTENLLNYIGELERCEADVVITHHHTVDTGTGEIKSWKSYPEKFGREYTFEEIIEHWEDFNRSLTFHGITYRTEFLQKIDYKLSEHVFYEDHEYSTFPCCYAKRIKPLDLFIYEYRIGDVEQSVSEANQLKRLSHTETVIQRLLSEYEQLSGVSEAQKRFVELKISILLLSYMTICLLVNPNRKEGRYFAKDYLHMFKLNAPTIYDAVQKKCLCFLLMNYLHMNNHTWERIKESRLYNLVKRRHAFTES